MLNIEIDRNLGPTTNENPRVMEVRELYKQLALKLNTDLPQSRELSLAITNLEQSYFWARETILRDRP